MKSSQVPGLNVVSEVLSAMGNVVAYTANPIIFHPTIHMEDIFVATIFFTGNQRKFFRNFDRFFERLRMKRIRSNNHVYQHDYMFLSMARSECSHHMNETTKSKQI